MNSITPFASRALALGKSLSMIGKPLGHNKSDRTSWYAHLARKSIKASSAHVPNSIGAAVLDGRPTDGAPSARLTTRKKPKPVPVS